MGNASSFNSKSSLCCIPLEDISETDDNTLKCSTRQLGLHPKTADILTPDEINALKSSNKVPGVSEIKGDFSFSSLSSKDSSKGARERENEHIYHVDEMRNDCAVCNEYSDEERIDSSYDEGATEALNSYYYADNGSYRRSSFTRSSVYERRE